MLTQHGAPQHDCQNLYSSKVLDQINDNYYFFWFSFHRILVYVATIFLMGPSAESFSYPSTVTVDLVSEYVHQTHTVQSFGGVGKGGEGGAWPLQY